MSYGFLDKQLKERFVLKILLGEDSSSVSFKLLDPPPQTLKFLKNKIDNYKYGYLESGRAKTFLYN